MPASVRDILLVIKTKEDAQRAMSGIATSMRRAAAQADAASARARAAALRAQATQARIAGATQDQINSLTRAAQAQDRHAASIERAQKKSSNLGQTIERVGTLAQTTGLILAGMGAGALLGFRQAVDVAAEWDKQVRLTYTQVDKRLKPSLEELSDIGLRVSRNVAVPFEKVQEALFDVFSSTEATMPQAEKLLTSFAKAAVAGNTDVQTASRATIGLMNAYKIPFKDVNKILDIQFQLVQEGVGTYEEWAQRIGLVTPSAVRAGQSIETMAAALSTSTRMGTSAARSGTAVARAFDAMSNPKTEKALKGLGVATRDAKGNFRPLVDVLTDWRKQLEKLPKKDRIGAILDTLRGAGSTIEARRFLQGILLTKGGLELFQDQIKEFATDKGAFQRAYNEMSEGVRSKSQVLHNSWMQVKLALGEALMPTFLKLIEVGQRVLDWFNKLPKSTQQTIARVVAFGAALTVVAGVLLIVVGSFIAFASAVALAGTALIPVAATMLAVGAAVAILVAGLIALGAAMFIAYQKSETFRAVIDEIWLAIKDVWDIIVNFALGVKQSFDETIVPALRRLWTVIETEVLPKVQEFVSWWRENMTPMIQGAADIIENQLKHAFEAVAQMIDQDLIPLLKDLSAWWDRNKESMLPVIKFLGFMLISAIALAAFLSVGMVFALALCVKWFIAVARAVKDQVVGSFRILFFQTQLVIAIIKKVWEWFKKLGDGAKQGATQAMTAMLNLKNRIMGLFASAGTWLISAGRNLIAGFVGGIRNGAGAVQAAARGVAQSAIAAAKATLGEHSPSKVFKDIGKDVIRGFILGVRDAKTLKQLQTAMYRVSRDVIRSINAADIKKSAKDKMRVKWNKRLASATKKLTALELKREAVQKKLTAAQKNLDDQRKARDDLRTKVRDAIAASADLTTLTDQEKSSPAWMKRGLNDRLAAVKAFSAQLHSLAKKGLDKQTLADLASQGVDQAGALVAKLDTMSAADLKEISKIQAEIRKIAGETGKTVSDDMYSAGIKAAEGLVKGLQSQMANITKQMNAIAQALVKAIKKELGIKSPSRVFMELGVNTAQGYVNGYVDFMNKNLAALQTATAFQPQGAVGRVASGGVTDPQVYPGLTRHYEQNITIHTQEINPQRHAAELGWLLESRVS